MDGNSQVPNVLIISTPAKEDFGRTKLASPNVIITEVMDLSNEYLIISATASISCIMLIVVIYCLHRLYQCKRSCTHEPMRNLNSQEYFTRPRWPVLFLDEVAEANSNSEHPVYWQRPLHPISIDKDMYCVVTRY